MEQPLVTIIIPTGPRHQALVPVAVSSCLWQSLAAWRCIVVNDAPTPLAPFADPRVSIIETGGGNGPARSRNIGLRETSTPFVLFLDADDYLLPEALARFIRWHATHDAAYTYGKHYAITGDRWSLIGPRSEYQQRLYERYNIHIVTALLPTEAVQAVGGFDEGVTAWEDWTLYLRMAMAGYCGRVVPEAIMVYRVDHSERTHIDSQQGLAGMEAVRQRYRNSRGEMSFMGCNCGGAAANAKAVAQQLAPLLGGAITGGAMETITLEYVGRGEGKQSFRVNGRRYQAGRAMASRYLSTANGLHPADIEGLVATGLFRILPAVQPFVAPPAPAEQISAAPAIAPSNPAPDDDSALSDDEIAVPSAETAERFTAPTPSAAPVAQPTLSLDEAEQLANETAAKEVAKRRRGAAA